MSQRSETACVALNRMLSWMVPLIIVCAIGIWWYENRQKERAAAPVVAPAAGRAKSPFFMARDPDTGEPIDFQTLYQKVTEKVLEEAERQGDEPPPRPTFAPAPGTGLKAKK